MLLDFPHRIYVRFSFPRKIKEDNGKNSVLLIIAAQGIFGSRLTETNFSSRLSITLEIYGAIRDYKPVFRDFSKVSIIDNRTIPALIITNDAKNWPVILPIHHSAFCHGLS